MLMASRTLRRKVYLHQTKGPKYSILIVSPVNRKKDTVVSVNTMQCIQIKPVN